MVVLVYGTGLESYSKPAFGDGPIINKIPKPMTHNGFFTRVRTRWSAVIGSRRSHSNNRRREVCVWAPVTIIIVPGGWGDVWARGRRESTLISFRFDSDLSTCCVRPRRADKPRPTKSKRYYPNYGDSRRVYMYMYIHEFVSRVFGVKKENRI